MTTAENLVLRGVVLIAGRANWRRELLKLRTSIFVRRLDLARDDETLFDVGLSRALIDAEVAKGWGR